MTWDLQEKSLNRGRTANRAASAVLLVLLAAGVVFAGLLCLLPPIARDELIHHLALPKLWLRAGTMSAASWSFFSHYPMNLELLYVPMLAAGWEAGARFIHLAFGLGTAALIFFHLRLRLGAVWGLAGALIFFSTPQVLRLACTAYVDLGLTFFVTLAVFSLIWWKDSGRDAWFYVSAVALGLGLGTKYNGLLALPLLTLAAIWLAGHRGRGAPAAVMYGLTYALVAVAFFSPWLIKNFVQTGNPLYPLYNGLFGLPPVAPGGLDLGAFSIRSGFYSESFTQTLLIPVRAFFQGRDYDPRFFDGVLNPVLLLGPVIALVRPKSWEARPLVLLAATWILLVFFRVSFIVRYIVPVLPALAVLAVYGLASVFDGLSTLSARKVSAAVMVLVMALILWPNATWAVGHWRHLGAGEYLFGGQSRQEYLDAHLDQYRAIDFINRNLPQDARVLLLFAGNRGYYLDRDYFYSAYHSGESIRSILERSTMPEEVSAGIKALGATDALVRDDLLWRYIVETMPPEKARLWQDFHARYWRRIFRANGFSVYTLL